MIQKSRFIGQCYPIAGEDEATEYISQIRKSRWDANHHCYAFRIGAGGMISRSSDDGEPSGTAGIPILNVLNRQSITNALIVVTRYFGGILLGAGGLVRAYGSSASEALKGSGIVRMEQSELYRLTLSYPIWATFERVLRGLSEIQDISYTDAVQISFYIPSREKEEKLRVIFSALEGRASPVYESTVMRAAK